MYFIKGFQKQAAFDHNNQGLEFQMAEGAVNPAYPGNEAMSGTGIATFVEQKAVAQSKKKKADPVQAAQLIFGKVAEDQTYGGGRMQTAEALGDASKYTFTSGWDPSKPEPEYKTAAKEKKMFAKGFKKQAGIGSSLWKGLKAGGGETIGSAMKLEGLKHISDAVKKGKGIGETLKSPVHRELLAEAVGKAAPSIAAAGAYGYGGKKLYDKYKSPSTTDQYGYYQ